eukprot:CAMPEP_0116564288 /NCGR_PEP_ID=MMETSP0397-20121206/13222_1 /TAXON_ID=216820 /ORGANISM="Cyclophora tenuis, Strain ECT3854" /LENGTH=82 /DNA_ID=CAMNT_0004090859 /DNA_START=22 /DNA_END=270 /DNA_ORIENTATION=+
MSRSTTTLLFIMAFFMVAITSVEARSMNGALRTLSVALSPSKHDPSSQRLPFVIRHSDSPRIEGAAHKLRVALVSRKSSTSP